MSEDVVTQMQRRIQAQTDMLNALTLKPPPTPESLLLDVFPSIPLFDGLFDSISALFGLTPLPPPPEPDVWCAYCDRIVKPKVMRFNSIGLYCCEVCREC